MSQKRPHPVADDETGKKKKPEEEIQQQDKGRLKNELTDLGYVAS